MTPCAKSKKKEAQTPDCAASKATLVTTPEGEQVCVSFNMGTSEVRYEPAEVCACKTKQEKTKDS